MIASDTTLPIALAAAGVVIAMIAPGVEIPVDPTAIAGGSVGVALLWIARNVFRRVDDLIRVTQDVADRWGEHVQRTENIHRAVGHLLQAGHKPEPGAPTESMLNDITPRPVTIRDRNTRTRSTDQ